LKASERLGTRFQEQNAAMMQSNSLPQLLAMALR
jgi:hypothetical protein